MKLEVSPVRYALATIVLAGIAWAAASLVHPRAQVFVRSYDSVLGTSMEVKVQATSADAADRAVTSVLDEIDRESGILSGYDPSSEFRRWAASRNIAVPVSPELFAVLEQFDLWRARTHGALDAAAETVSAVWKASEVAGRMPTDGEIAGAVGRVQQAHWRLDPVARTATHLSDALLILNTFTKSYIIDRAAAAGLNTPGVSGIVVNIGGDVVTRGAITGTIGITDPQAAFDNASPLASLAVSDRAVATSGVYRRGFTINGAHYSHIVDPRTGKPTGHVLSATVVAKSAADAGAMATAFCVLTPDESERLSRQVPGAEFMLVLADGQRIESAGWRRLTKAPAPVRTVDPVATLHAAEQGTWSPDYELGISFTIATKSFRAERPYIAVWIENKDHVQVRTLAVWFKPRHERYLNELRAWYRGDRDRQQAQGTDLLDSVSSATRNPGAYTLVWNGKDDAGKLVRAGTYTVSIEASREHGSYQIYQQAMNFTGVPAKVDLAAGLELSGASLDYHRVAVK